MYLYYIAKQIIITKEQLKLIGGILEEQSNNIRAYSFDWDDNNIYYKGKTYSKQHFKDGTGPWEKPAYANEIKAK